MDYISLNKDTWNLKTGVHVSSEFYNMEGFLKGENSLNSIELNLLGNVEGKRIAHLQCHFGQDSLSLARMGARVTGLDLSDVAIEKARKLNEELGLDANFVCGNVYDAAKLLDEKFDIVFTSYGTIGWLPDMELWAKVVSDLLKPGGEFVFVEFHPVVWMFDDQFERVAYDYFNTGPIVEETTGTYTDRDAPIQTKSVFWNHGLGEVMSSILKSGLKITSFEEFDYSPYNCFLNTKEIEKGKYVINSLEKKIPMVYALKAVLPVE